MKYAIIAAGEGSRLQREGVGVPKPLVRVHGECLIDRLLRVFMENNAEEIAVICNDQTDDVSRHLREVQENGLDGRSVPLRFIVKSTPSSMHSFFELIRLLFPDQASESPFILTTVDTIFLDREFRLYVEAFHRTISEGGDGLMGVTDYIDDEKPLFVKTCNQRITAFLDSDPEPHYVSGGIYGLSPKSIVTLRACIERGESRMRNFQRALLADGLDLRAYAFSKVLDIDHVADIAKAEAFLETDN